MSGPLVVEAPAKVNLLLRVLHRRPDGFHELETLFQAISLADVVEVALSEQSSRSEGPHITLKVVGPDLGRPEDNLAYRAAARFLEETDTSHAVGIRLTKRVPAGGGLGGGSSDAAAVLRCLAALTGKGDPGLLRALGPELGSDVPFFLGSGPLALGRGRGERLTPLPALPVAHLVLALPPLRVSTAEAYGALAARRLPASPEREHSRRETSEPETSEPETSEPETSEPETSGLEDSSPLSNLTWQRIEALAENDFEPVATDRYREVRRSLDGLSAEGADWALLSGSGAACFGMFPDRERAARAAARLTVELGWLCTTAHTLAEMPQPRPAGCGRSRPASGRSGRASTG